LLADDLFSFFEFEPKAHGGDPETRPSILSGYSLLERIDC
jgi:hypothetical protein